MPIGDKITKANNGVLALPTKLASNKGTGDTAADLEATTGWPQDATDGPVHFAMFKVDPDNEEKVSEGTLSFWKATLTGSTLSNMQRTGGPSLSYEIGDSVLITSTPGFINDLVEALLVSLNRNGSIKDDAISDVDMFASGVIDSTDPFSSALNPETRLLESLANFVASGLVWSIVSGLNGAMTAGVAYASGKRISLSAIASYAFTASKDTYVYVTDAGVLSYDPQTNGAAQPATPTTSVLLAKVVTSGSAITSIVAMPGKPVTADKIDLTTLNQLYSSTARTLTNNTPQTLATITVPAAGTYRLRTNLTFGDSGTAGQADVVFNLLVNGASIGGGGDFITCQSASFLASHEFEREFTWTTGTILLQAYRNTGSKSIVVTGSRQVFVERVG